MARGCTGVGSFKSLPLQPSTEAEGTGSRLQHDVWREMRTQPAWGAGGPGGGSTSPKHAVSSAQDPAMENTLKPDDFLLCPSGQCEILLDRYLSPNWIPAHDCAAARNVRDEALPWSHSPHQAHSHLWASFTCLVCLEHLSSPSPPGETALFLHYLSPQTRSGQNAQRSGLAPSGSVRAPPARTSSLSRLVASLLVSTSRLHSSSGLAVLTLIPQLPPSTATVSGECLACDRPSNDVGQMNKELYSAFFFFHHKLLRCFATDQFPRKTGISDQMLFLQAFKCKENLLDDSKAPSIAHNTCSISRHELKQN